MEAPSVVINIPEGAEIWAAISILSAVIFALWRLICSVHRAGKIHIEASYSLHDRRRGEIADLAERVTQIERALGFLRKFPQDPSIPPPS